MQNDMREEKNAKKKKFVTAARGGGGGLANGLPGKRGSRAPSDVPGTQ